MNISLSTEHKNLIIVNIGKKFSENNLDELTDQLNKFYLTNSKYRYLFVFYETEWISSQGLILIYGILKYFSLNEIEFDFEFLRPHSSVDEIPPRVAFQFIQLMEVKLYQLLPIAKQLNFISVYDPIYKQIRKDKNINLSRFNIYSNYEITPIISLDYIANYLDKDIEDMLTRYLALNSATEEIIYKYNCEHPFISGVLGAIIVKELYENFLDHFSNNFLKSKKNQAFMSLSLLGKLSEDYYSQGILEKNFYQEAIPETIDFYKDPNTKLFKNQSLVQFSFLDFGDGIINTLRDSFNEFRKVEEQNSIFNEAEILDYAFHHDSSRYPIYNKYGKKEIYIPRGLFDVWTIVKRYQGLLVVRSNHGKILYDFSNNKTEYKKFGNSQLFFPGTLINIYLPAFEFGKKFDKSVIKPIKKIPLFPSLESSVSKMEEIVYKKKYIDLYPLIKERISSKEELYSNLFKHLHEKIYNENQDTKTIIYFNFSGYDLDVRLTKKIIYFLLSNYEININNNIILLNPPSQIILEEINLEILNLSSIVKDYKIHPLPCVYYDELNQSIKIYWLGIYNEEDKQKLNDVFFKGLNFKESDFKDPTNVIGNLAYFDENGALKGYLPKAEEIIKYYKEEIFSSSKAIVQKLINENNCFINNDNQSLYLCNGNYYQYEYLNLINLLDKPSDCNVISKLLYENLKHKINKSINYKYIAITSSSHKILNSLVKQNFIRNEDVYLLDNFYTYESEDIFTKIESDCNYILVCDIIATGTLTEKLIKLINQKKSNLDYVAVIASTIDKNFENSGYFLEKYEDRVILLFEREIKKYRRNNSFIRKDLQDKKIIRINPYTSIPVSLSIQETNIDTIIIQDNNEFLNMIDQSVIKIGYLYFNNVIHPYFFETKEIIKSNNEVLFDIIFNYMKLPTKNLKILFPKSSGIEEIDFNLLRNRILHDHSIEEYMIERFSSDEGWKFPHTTDYFKNIICNQNVFILDDGSCTGDSLIQMINQTSLFNPQKIMVLSLIGRLNDHKREFFSNLSQVKNGINISIYFCTHWHIPTYYMTNNPISDEVNWINEILNFENIPNSIKHIANKVLVELRPKKRENFKEYSFLPKGIDRKKLIKVRDEIGKVIGLRFYIESFKYFDDFVKKYETNIISSDRYEDVELLCSAIIFEPYLFDEIDHIMPDVGNKVQEFIDSIIFGNPNRNNKYLDTDKNLVYVWDKKNFILLFFIVYKGDKLKSIFSDEEKVIKLIKYIEKVGKSLNYFFYKLLWYFPINKNDLSIYQSSYYIHLIDAFIQNKYFTDKSKRDVRIFRSFISTLPSNQDYFSMLSEISTEYRNILEAEHHKYSVLAQIDRMQMDIEGMKSHFVEINIGEFLESWSIVVHFIEKILSFSISFPNFFFNKISKVEGPEKDNLRLMHGKLNSLINNINMNSNFNEIGLLLEKIKNSFLISSCDFSRIFNKITTPNSLNVIYEIFFKNNLVKDSQFSYYNENNIIEGFPKDNNITLDFPSYLFENIILNHIINNFRHKDKKSKIQVCFHLNDESITIEFTNMIDAESEPGGGNGHVLLMNMNRFPNNLCGYSFEINANIYKQKLLFKRI